MLRMLRGLCFLFLVGAAIGAGNRHAEAGYAHFIYDATSGQVLAAENADVINHPASLTKMMTLYLTFEALKTGRLHWDDQIVMTANAASKIPFKLGIKAGKTITVREAVYGMAIRSANDAAAAMGDHLGGTEERFGEIMTAKAQALGMRQTVFRNASGLPDAAQVTTAHDMAIMALSLIRDYPEEYKIFSMRSFQFRGRKVPGHNHLMYRYPGMDGVKTGFVNASGFNIASAVTVNGKRYIGVVMGGKSARKRDDQMAALLDQYIGVPAGTPPMAMANAAPAQPAATSTAKPAPAASPAKRPADTTRQMAYAGQSGNAANEAVTSLAKGARPANVPVPTTPVPSEQATADAGGAQAWSIQIAAAASRDAASDLLEKAMPLLANNFGSIAPSVEGYSSKGREYFRARFVGFADQDAASSACQSLQARAVKCIVVH